MTIRGGGLKHVACAEDEDFIQALDKMMLENLQVGHPAYSWMNGLHILYDNVFVEITLKEDFGIWRDVERELL